MLRLLFKKPCKKQKVFLKANLALTGSVAAAASIAMEECSKQFATEVIFCLHSGVDVDGRQNFLQEYIITWFPLRCGTALSLHLGQGTTSARITGEHPIFSMISS